MRKTEWYSNSGLLQIASPSGHARVDLVADMGKMKRNRGFSLVELTMILAILAIVAGLSVPVLSSSMRNWRLAGDARNIVTALTYAKLTAASQMTRSQLTFDLSGNTWSVMKFNRSTNNYDLQGSINRLSDGLANSGIGFKSSSTSAPSGYPTASSTSITINSRGIAIDGSGNPTTHSVFLSDAGTDYVVTVSLAGRVQLWRNQNGSWMPQ